MKEKKNISTIILCILLVISLLVLIMFMTNYIKTKKEQEAINKNIHDYDEMINKINEDNTQIQTETDKIKEESKSKVEEYNIWLETKEKLEKAIS